MGHIACFFCNFYKKDTGRIAHFSSNIFPNQDSVQHYAGLLRKTYENQPGDLEMNWISVALEECLEALGILPDNQAAKPKRHL